jgi:single-strand DNA-binding protein
MASIAKVTLVGNLGRDAELRYTPSGAPLLDFSVATNERWNDRNGQTHEHTQWFRVTLWGRQAEVLKQYLVKGKQVFVDGTLRAREYEDREGQRRTSLDVRADNITLLGGRGEGEGPRERRDTGGGPPGELENDDRSFGDEDIPF